MKYMISASTDIGIRKKTNQDSLFVKIADTTLGKAVFAVVCDGMGGLSKGELASATVVRAFRDWADNELPYLRMNSFKPRTIKNHWKRLIESQNQRIFNYGARHGLKAGTTAVAMLITESAYFIINAGDSRAYEITDKITQLTHDQTYVAQQIKQGIITEEQAEYHPRKNVLLQCVGASRSVEPEMYNGTTRHNAIYMLCSDGFRHTVKPNELFDHLNPEDLTDAGKMESASNYLIKINKQRRESDNISVALIRTC
jgi:serine/threonine protein phosphatase PrpC